MGDIDLSAYAALGLDGVRAILQDLSDGEMTPADAEDHILGLLAKLIDEAIPTGPFDLLDDEPIEQALRGGFELMRDLLQRESGKLSAAADRWEERIDAAQGEGRTRVGFPPISLERARARVIDLRAKAEAALEAELADSGGD